jgi:hypothetical protein
MTWTHDSKYIYGVEASNVQTPSMRGTNLTCLFFILQLQYLQSRHVVIVLSFLCKHRLGTRHEYADGLIGKIPCTKHPSQCLGWRKGRKEKNVIFILFIHNSQVFYYAVLRMRWHPLSVHTGSDSCPTSSANAASSKGFCIWPRSKYPRSPPRLALEQSERLVARAERVSSPDWILVWYSWMMAKASSFVRVIFSYTPPKILCVNIHTFFFFPCTDR